MKVKNDLDMLRWLTEVEGNHYESLINILLDKLNHLNKIEKELSEELKSEKSNL